MIKWIFTGCLITFIALMAGIAGAGVVNNTSGDISEEGMEGGTGIIYSIEGSAVTINDMKYNFSSNVKFLAKDGDTTSKSSFKEGDEVNYILNTNNKIIVLQKNK